MKDRKIAFAALILIFSIVTGDIVSTMIGIGGGGSLAITPQASTFTITSNDNGVSYNGYLSGSTTIPLFTETSFQTLMQTDILGSSACVLGCSISMLSGSFNQSDTINVTRPGITIIGTPASIIYPSNVAFHSSFRSVFNILPSATNFVAQGFKVDDYKRANQTGVAGDVFTHNGAGCLLNQLTIWNASSTAISAQGSNCIISFNTLLATVLICHNPQTRSCNGNFGVVIGTTANGIRIDFNTISGFNFTDSSAIQMAGASSSASANIEVGSNEIFGNSFGITSTWGKTLNIHDNKIHDNYAAGIVLTTQAIGTASPGPITITGNVITNNAKEPGTDPVCNNFHCSGIVLRGSKSGWDGITIVGNTIKDTQTIPTQLYDIDLLSVQYSNLTIVGNTLGRSSGNLGVHLNVNPLSSWIIAENPGFNPQAVRGPLTAGATPFTYTNNDGYKEQIELITIGDMTAFTCRGIANIIQVDAISPILNTLDTCVFTYVAIAPTYDVLPT